ncbi:MAG TPA: B12-binding domain-containing radical SAM protein [Candidatus Acidoferrales bacterium]|nr:B12-binding domain-containing radical SAM protein [Candidatus Acidoferrales bacterium]
MGKIVRGFSISSLQGFPKRKTALLISPPLYDTQYWAEWSQPYGLLRIAALLKKYQYKRIELFDFLETGEDRKVANYRINPNDRYSEQGRPIKTEPVKITKNGETLKLLWRHFGKSWEELEMWLNEKGFDKRHPPTEIYISAVMSYWWEAVRDLTIRLKNRFGDRPKIILGGIYPSIAPEHAARMTKADIIVDGEVEEANDLWPDISFYEKPQTYGIVTPSRGCPFNCSYCAQLKINAGNRAVRFRDPKDIVAEMSHKYDEYGIRDFAFYADFLLWDFGNNLTRVLERIISEKLPFRLYAPEGLDTKFLSSSQHLCDLLKESNFQKIYLPVESIDDGYLKILNRRHVKLEHYVKAVKMVQKAGFTLRNLDVNSFVLYGLPGEKIDNVVKTAMFVSEMVGSIIPMLYSPVPSTTLYQNHLPYFKERGWDKKLQYLNGKLYPFIHMNEGSISDYVDLQRMMFMLNAHYRSESFQLYGHSLVNEAFRSNIRNGFENMVNLYKGWIPEKEAPPIRVINHDEPGQAIPSK